MASTVLTPSGKHINLQKFCENDVDIEDITKMLSGITRFNGRGYTVLFHSLVMYEYAMRNGQKQLAVAALLHDTAEAYIGDIIQPVKEAVPEIAALEQRIGAAITRVIGIRSPFCVQELKKLDKLAMAVEYEEVFHAPYTQADPEWALASFAVHEVSIMREIAWKLRDLYPTSQSQGAYFELLCRKVML